MSKYKVGDRPVVKLTGGRIVEATVKAVFETTDGRSATDRSERSLLMTPGGAHRRGSLIVRSAPIVEEWRVRRQAGDLGESDAEWKREITTEWRSKSSVE